jgi:hypothetical protein
MKFLKVFQLFVYSWLSVSLGNAIKKDCSWTRHAVSQVKPANKPSWQRHSSGYLLRVFSGQSKGNCVHIAAFFELEKAVALNTEK